MPKPYPLNMLGNASEGIPFPLFAGKAGKILVGDKIKAAVKSMANVGAGLRGKKKLKSHEITEGVVTAILAGMPGGGSGVANIGKKDALKSLAHQVRAIRKLIGKKTKVENVPWQDMRLYATNRGKEAERINSQYIRHETKKSHMLPTVLRTTTSKKGYRQLTKAIRNTPQEVLDLVDKIYVGKQYRQGPYGMHTGNILKSKNTDGTLTFKKAKNKIIVGTSKKFPSDSIYAHEMVHAKQHKDEVVSIKSTGKEDRLSRVTELLNPGYSPVELNAEFAQIPVTNLLRKKRLTAQNFNVIGNRTRDKSLKIIRKKVSDAGRERIKNFDRLAKWGQKHNN